MPRYRVDPRQVQKVEMKDGTVYRPNRDGYVSVSHVHEAEMDRSPAARDRRGADLAGMTLSVPGIRGRTCAMCEFEGWPWQRKCPRCGGALK